MGLLVGLPLKLFYMLFVLLRFVWPVVLILVIRAVVKRLRGGQTGTKWKKTEQPDFDGPVYDVDYKILDDEQPEDES